MAVKLMLNIDEINQGKRIQLQLRKENNFYLMDEYTLSSREAKDILMDHLYKIIFFLESNKEKITAMDQVYAYLSIVHDENQLEYPVVYGKPNETIEAQMTKKENSCKRKIKKQLSYEAKALENLKLLSSSYTEEEYYLFSQFHRNCFAKDFYYQNYRYHPQRFMQHIKVWLNDLSKDRKLRYHKLRYLEQAIYQEELTFPNLYSILKKIQKENPVSSLLPKEPLKFDIEQAKEDSYLSYLVCYYNNDPALIFEEYHQVGDLVDDHIEKMLVKR